jgi:hypothetical protein
MNSHYVRVAVAAQARSDRWCEMNALGRAWPERSSGRFSFHHQLRLSVALTLWSIQAYNGTDAS